MDSSCTRRAVTSDSLLFLNEFAGDETAGSHGRHSSFCKLCFCSKLKSSMFGLLDPRLMYFLLQSADCSPSSVTRRSRAVVASESCPGVSNLKAKVTAFFGTVFLGTPSLYAKEEGLAELASVMVEADRE